MASTYVNNLRLEEMATGEQSGTWGTKTNTNLELVGQAFGWGTRAIANASTDNITIADGASDADRSMYLKLTGGGQACTVTLLPNTSSKMWIMENATSHTLTFTQGSGANVEVPAGQTKMIFADGLGSGAVVYEIGTLALGGLQSNGTVTVGVDDTGHDVKFFGATSGKYWLWDESADGVVQIGTLTIGVNDAGHDVKFFGDTANAYMLWDASADDLILAEPAKLGVGAAPNATFGSYLYTEGTPTANKPILGAYSKGNSNTGGIGLFNDSGNRGIWTTGSVMRFTRTYEGNSTDDMVIDASGLVGFGTASPSEELHIFAAAPTIKLEDSDNNLSGYINGDNGNVLVQSHNVNRDIIFGENAASGEIMRVTGLGNVGIGTSTPGAELEIAGDYQPLIVNSTNSSTAKIILEDNGATRGYLGAVSGIPFVIGRASDAASQFQFKDLNGFSQLYFAASTTAGGGAGGAYLQALGSNAASPPQIAGIDLSMTDGTDGSESGIIAFHTTNSGTSGERMRIDSGGRLLINKTTLQTVNAPLQVASGLGTGQIFVGNTSGTGYMFGRDNVTTGNFVLGEVSNDADTSVTNYLNIATGTGNATFISAVGIGAVPDADAKLDVSGQVLVRNTGAGVDTTPGGQYGFYIQPDSGGNVNLMSYSGGGSTQLRFYTNSGGAAAVERMSINSAGAVSVVGAFSKGSGSFKIDHPLPAKKDTHHLVHSFVEGPQADLIYRGRATLVDGQSSVNIDDAAGMTSGTFEVLCRDVQCFTSNETGWTAVRGSVTGATLTIEAQDNSCTDTISWMVVGERQDEHMYDTNWTDDDGKVIVEPLKQKDE